MACLGEFSAIFFEHLGDNLRPHTPDYEDTSPAPAIWVHGYSTQTVGEFQLLRSCGNNAFKCWMRFLLAAVAAGDDHDNATETRHES